MLKAKKGFKRATKQELKHDSFIEFTYEAKDWIEKNAQMLLLAVAAVVAVIAIGYFYSSSKAAAAQEAAVLLSRAQQEMRMGQKESALALYNEVTDKYAGTDASGKAAFFLGKMFWEDNDITQAKSYFKRYIDDHSEKNILTQAALAGYADCLANEKVYGEAAKYYERAAKTQPDFPQAVAYLFSAAQSYYDAGEMGKAKTLAQEIIDNYKDPVFINRAEMLLAGIE